MPSSVEHGGRAKQEGCELCDADRFTHWYAETKDGWVADCEVCSVPMVVCHWHGPEPPAATIDRLLAALTAAADARFGEGNWSIDRQMRQVPEHFHAHARDKGWWDKRFSRPMSRYTGVGSERREMGDQSPTPDALTT